MKYDKYMDKECIVLCDALNSIKGIETYESCCGHGKQPFMIWFWLDKKYFPNFHIIKRVTDRRYGGFQNVNHGDDMWTNTGWVVESSEANDIYHKNKLSFLLTSREYKGDIAYQQSEKIAKNIYEHLKHTAYCKGFGIIQ